MRVIAAALLLAASDPQVRLERVKADIEFLASAELNGRASLEPGGTLAARYVAAQFRQAGLRPFDGRGYLSEVPLSSAVLDSADSRLVLDRGGVQEIFQPGRDFQGGFKEDVESAAGLAFAGYGITAPEYGYDDYAGLDVRGKVVLVLSREPFESAAGGRFRGPGLTPHSALRVKRLNAQAHGAAAVLLIPAQQPATAARPASSTRGYASTLYDEDIRIPMLSLTAEAASRIVPLAGQWRERIESSGQPCSTSLPGSLALRLKTKDRMSGVTYNVIGLIEGSDPALKREAIVLGAHYDHLPNRAGFIYPGANDNASGVAAILEVARLLREQDARPRRTLVFVSFAAEENGLLGAYHYAAHPVLPLDATRAVVSLDMVARDEAHVPATEGLIGIPADASSLLNVSGAAWSPGLAAAITRAAGRSGLNIDDKYDRDPTQGVLWRSDHFPFLVRGVPAVWLFAGFHPGYHEATETPEKLNYSKLEKVIRLTRALALDLAGAERPPAFLAR